MLNSRGRRSAGLLTSLMAYKSVKKIAIFILLTLAVWHLFNIPFYWRQYRASRLIKTTGFVKEATSAKPLFSEDVLSKDPEAADIANYTFRSKPNLNGYTGLLLKYPESDFLIFRIIEECLKTDSVSPAVNKILITGLLKSAPSNAYFHYLNAQLAAQLASGDRYAEVLRSVTVANEAPELVMPFDMYNDRIISLIQDEGLEPIKLWPITEGQCLYSWAQIRRLSNTLARYAEYLSFTGRPDECKKLLYAHAEMGDRFWSKANSIVQAMVALDILSEPRRLMLRYNLVSGEEAKTARVYLGAARSAYHYIIRTDTIHSRTKDLASKLMVIGVSYFGTLMLYCLLIFLVIVVIGWKRGNTTAGQLNWKDYVLFPLSLGIWLSVSAILAYRSPEAPQLSQAENSAREVLRSGVVLSICAVLWVVARFMAMLPAYNKPCYKYLSIKSWLCALLFSTLCLSGALTYWNEFSWQEALIWALFSVAICLCLWLILMYGWWLIRQLPWRWINRNRYIQLLLITTSFAAIFVMVDSWLVKRLLGLLLVAVIAVVITCRPYKETPALIRGIGNLFGKDDFALNLRCKLRQLSCSYAVVSFVFALVVLTFSASLHRKIYSLREQEKEVQRIKSNFSPIEDTRKRFVQSLFKKCNGELPDLSDLSAMWPEELRKILELVAAKNPKEIEWKTHGMHEIGRIVGCCGLEALSVFLDYVENPDSEQALYMRSRTGDKSALDGLRGLIDICSAKPRMVSNMHSTNLDPLIAMANIMPAGEIEPALERLLEDCNCNRIYLPSFIELLKQLPQDMSKRFLKQYLKKVDYVPLGNYSFVRELSGTSRLFFDAELAKSIYRQLLEKSFARDHGKPVGASRIKVSPSLADFFKEDPHGIRLRKAIATYLDETAIPLLKRGVVCPGNSMRAYSLWQLTRLGYDWSEDELNKLYQDDAFEVRANAVMAGNMDLVDKAANDKSAFVRLVAKLRGNNI